MIEDNDYFISNLSKMSSYLVYISSDIKSLKEFR